MVSISAHQICQEMLLLQRKEFSSQLQCLMYLNLATLSTTRLWKTSDRLLLSTLSNWRENWQSRKTTLWSRTHDLQGILERCSAGVHMQLSRERDIYKGNFWSFTNILLEDSLRIVPEHVENMKKLVSNQILSYVNLTISI